MEVHYGMRRNDGRYFYASIKRLPTGAVNFTITDEERPVYVDGILEPEALHYRYPDFLKFSREWRIEERIV